MMVRKYEKKTSSLSSAIIKPKERIRRSVEYRVEMIERTKVQEKNQTISNDSFPCSPTARSITRSVVDKRNDKIMNILCLINQTFGQIPRQK
mmetsp:Transcript_43551/g.44243  ORF Transcript_43551/g.44243 Transcript_43551/m.44243 type:complete len:92 (+) Transcript_43551:450-725(+)